MSILIILTILTILTISHAKCTWHHFLGEGPVAVKGGSARQGSVWDSLRHHEEGVRDSTATERGRWLRAWPSVDLA